MTGSAGEIGWALEALLLAERELLLFAGFWIAVGLADELAIDLSWLWLKLTGSSSTQVLPPGYGTARLKGPIAVFIPAFAESAIIGMTIRYLLKVWPQEAVRIYVGCYRNDPATLAAAVAVADHDSRLRLVLLDAQGPTTKADCLNRLYAALYADEERSGTRYRGVILHDAEDMVHPAALQAIDAALTAVDFVQLPVRPVLTDSNRWVSGHYADEFTENHAKVMVVRNALGLTLPAAGVGCGLSRSALERLAERKLLEGQHGPFSADALTEDYELGLALSRTERGSAFLRLRAADGSLVATASCFPETLAAAVRQKSRWIHGIAFQGWDRFGWSQNPLEFWMALRDRRGPLNAIVLTAAYALLVLDTLLVLGEAGGFIPSLPSTPVHRFVLVIGLAGLAWRVTFRFAFVSREYDWSEGLRAVLRIPVANIIAIMAGRRAVFSYAKSLIGAQVTWDKTEHLSHPAANMSHEIGV